MNLRNMRPGEVKALVFLLVAVVPAAAFGIAWESTEDADIFRRGDVEGVKRLLDSKRYQEDPYFKDNPDFITEALMISISSGNLDLIRYLKNRGWLEKCRKYNRCFPLHDAAGLGKLGIVKYLMSQGFEVKSRLPKKEGRGTALHSAVGGAHFEVVRFLCDQGVDNNVRNHYGKTAWNLAKDMSKMRSSDPKENAHLRTNVQKIIEYLTDRDCTKK